VLFFSKAHCKHCILSNNWQGETRRNDLCGFTLHKGFLVLINSNHRAQGHKLLPLPAEDDRNACKTKRSELVGIGQGLVCHNAYPKRFDLSLELIDAAAGTDKVCHAASQLMHQPARRVFETANAANTLCKYLTHISCFRLT